MKLLERVGDAACAASLELLQGHGIRIGSTLEYLLHSIPFDVMKVQGVLGWEILRAIPKEACHHHHPVHTGHADA